MTARREVLLGSLGIVAAAGMGMGRAMAQSMPSAAPANDAPYVAGTAVGPLDIINLHDLEAQAEKLIPKAPFGYISGGSGDEWTLRENVRAFDDRQILPRYLASVDTPDTSIELLGSKLDIPLFIPPMAAHGLAHKSAEIGSAKGAADAGALFCTQTLANARLEDIGKASRGPKWFQLYYAKDMGINRSLAATNHTRMLSCQLGR